MDRMTISDLIGKLRYNTRIIVYPKTLEFKKFSDTYKWILDFMTFDYFENHMKEQEEIINNSEVAYFEICNNGIVVFI